MVWKINLRWKPCLHISVKWKSCKTSVHLHHGNEFQLPLMDIKWPSLLFSCMWEMIPSVLKKEVSSCSLLWLWRFLQDPVLDGMLLVTYWIGRRNEDGGGINYTEWYTWKIRFVIRRLFTDTETVRGEDIANKNKVYLMLMACFQLNKGQFMRFNGEPLAIFVCSSQMLIKKQVTLSHFASYLVSLGMTNFDAFWHSRHWHQF